MQVKDPFESRKFERHNLNTKGGLWLQSVLLGHFRYYGVSSNSQAMAQIRCQIVRAWCQVLRRISQRQRAINWGEMKRIADRCLPMPRIYHSHPLGQIGVIT
jgi:RNA-directed DNA polymerase